MKNIFIIILLLGVLLSLTSASNAQQVDVKKYGAVKSRSINGNELVIKGLNLVTDPEFKKVLSQFLYYHEQLDDKNIYNYLSREYLKKRFPRVKNAADYVKAMEMNETSEVKYLEITKAQNVKNQYEVDILSRARSEGIHFERKNKYYFIKENNDWKYNGFTTINTKELPW